MIFLSPSQNNKRIFAIAMGVYTFVALIALGSLSQHQFELDDLAYLNDLDQIHQDPSAIFSADRRLPGRPVTDMALLLIQMSFTDNPTAFHVALVFCHLITTFLLTFTFLKTGLNQELSLIGGLFFLINLAHFRAIHWISCLAYPLSLSWGCVGILAYIAYHETPRYKWYGISVCGFVLAILSHPAAIVCPAFIAYFTWQKKQPMRPILSIGIISLAVLIGLLKLFPQVPQAEHATAVLQWHIIDLIQHGFWYLGRLWVSTFTVFREMNDIQTPDLLLGVLAVIGVIVLWYYRIFPTAHWGIWMLLSTVVFITNPNQTHFESGPSRHLYFASAGSAALLAWACQQLSLKISRSSQSRPKICLTLLVTLITGLSIVGLKKSEAFTYIISARTYLVTNQKEKATQLFEKAVAQAPQLVSSAMYERFPIANLAEGKFLNDSLHQALAQYPDNKLIVAIRMIYGFQSNTVDHQHLTDRIVAFAQQNTKDIQEFVAISCLNLGYFYATKLQHSPAEILYQGALKLKPGYPEAAVHLSQIYIKQKKIDAARQILHLAINHYPTHVDALQNLAALYHREKDWDQTEKLYKRLLTQQPHATDILFKLGYIYMSQKNYAEARPLFETLTQQTPKNWQGFAYLGQCLHAQGHTTAAVRAYQRALKLKPNQPELQVLLRQLTP
ncbi:MAG: tetratricopeptide (TPR) repeat protein [Candidatus Latescibacterota bacterium]